MTHIGDGDHHAGGRGQDEPDVQPVGTNMITQGKHGVIEPGHLMLELETATRGKCKKQADGLPRRQS